MQVKRILIDCDGVLADIVTALRDRLHAEGYRIPPEDEWMLGTSVVGKQLPPFLQDRMHEILAEPGFVTSIPWYPGAKEFVRALSADHHVLCVTSPFHRSLTWMPERVEWLREVLPAKQVLFVPSEEKWSVFGDVLIEDREDIAERWLLHNQGGAAILFDRPWNHGRGALPHWRSYTQILFSLSRAA